jgi:calcineurin-like phosphoesterase family protein
MATNNALEITLDTWIISDTHFFHENIGRYCSRPENWQELIIKNWNDLVSPDETILHLGDFALGNKSNFDLLSGMLRGRLFLIQGNHDRISKSYCEPRGVTLIKKLLERPDI